MRQGQGGQAALGTRTVIHQHEEEPQPGPGPGDPRVLARGGGAHRPLHTPLLTAPVGAAI